MILKNIVKMVMVVVLVVVISGCSLRMGDYGFQEDGGLDVYYHDGAASYFEGEFHTNKFYDLVNLSLGMGFLRGNSGGKVNYSTENATHYFPHTKDAITAHMWDTRITARAYPLKSVNIFKSGWAVSPYAG
ncbi:MAG: hypothetical protein KAR20_14290, partial [Candidatus Heimdallarchaeota archaeon]|nr:hypothetical protein [Candidatus Heimdallarchaeota archaeon]